MGILSQWAQQAKSTLKDYAGSQATGFKKGVTTDPTLTQGSRRFIVTIKQDQDTPVFKGLGRDPMVVVGQIAEDFTIDQDVRWDTPWGAGLIGDAGIANLLALTGTRLVSQVMTLQVWQGAGNDIDFTVSFELRAWSSTLNDVMIPLQYLLAMSMPSRSDNGFLRSPGPILDTESFAKMGQGIPKAVSRVSSAAGEAFKEIAGAASSAVTGSMSDGATSALSVVSGNSPAMKNLSKTIGEELPSADSVSKNMKNKISISIGDWFTLENIVVVKVSHTLKPQMIAGDGGLMSANVTVVFRPMFALTANDIPRILRGADPEFFKAA